MSVRSRRDRPSRSLSSGFSAGEDGRQLLECGLARAVTAPAGVRVHAGVAGDVDRRALPGLSSPRTA